MFLKEEKNNITRFCLHLHVTDTETNLIVGTRVSEKFGTYYWFLHEVIVAMLHLTTEIATILCFKKQILGD